MDTIDANTRIIDLTVGELREILKEGREPAPTPATSGPAQIKYVYGMKGIADLFGCSLTTANKIKGSGVLDNAITQFGNTIITDVEKALAATGRPDRRKKKGSRWSRKSTR